MNASSKDYLPFEVKTTLPITKDDSDLIFIFKDNQIMLLKDDSNFKLPTRKHLKNHIDDIDNIFYLGDLNGVHCYTGEVKEIIDKSLFDFISLRQLSAFISKDIFAVCGKSYQILHWNNNSKYCGRCGSENIIKEGELAKICPKCSMIVYPRISPAIIVTVTKGNEILLAHNKNFPKGLHSNVAGFLEPCETLEDCVKREVYEETSLKVKNIKYFGNQPWPYPDSLMIGFFAEYESGEIKVDGEEIECAHWFTADNLPMLPEKFTIARQMIDSFLESLK